MFQLQKENKYICGLKKFSRLVRRDIKAYKLELIEIISAAVVVSSIGSVISKVMNYKDTNIAIQNIESVADHLGLNLPGVFLNHQQLIQKMEDYYYSLSDDKKSLFITELFYEKLNSLDFFTEEQKEEINDSCSKFLEDYGYLYDIENILGIDMVLDDVDLVVDDEFSGNVLGEYYYDTIHVRSWVPVETLSHEVEHAITCGAYQAVCGRDSFFPNFIIEAIDSSTDYFYNHYNSYCNDMRNQILFLSKIIGRDKLLGCYLNQDVDELKKIIGEDSDRLFSIFRKELKYLRNNDHVTISDDLCEEATEALRDLYEKKTNKSIEDDFLMNMIYQCCLPGNGYLTRDTLFEDDFHFQYVGINKFHQPVQNDYVVDCQTGELEKIDYENKLNELEESIRSFITGGNGSLNVMGYRGYLKLRYLFTDDRYIKMICSDSIVEYLRNYLKELGTDFSDRCLYNLLNDNLFCNYSVDVFDKKEDRFLETLAKVYEEKYQYLCNRGMNYMVCDQFQDLFGKLYYTQNELTIDEKVLSLFLDQLDPDADLNEFIYNYYYLSGKDSFSRIQYNYSNFNQSDYGFQRLRLLFTDKRFQEMISSDNGYQYLFDYLKGVLTEKSDEEIVAFIYQLIVNKSTFLLSLDELMDSFSRIYLEKCREFRLEGRFLEVICDYKELFGFLFEGDSYFSKLYEEGVVPDQEYDVYEGLSWAYKDYIDHKNSVMTYRKSLDQNHFILPDLEMEYTFEYQYEEVQPVYVNDLQNGYIEYLFDIELEENQYINVTANSFYLNGYGEVSSKIKSKCYAD